MRQDKWCIKGARLLVGCGAKVCRSDIGLDGFSVLRLNRRFDQAIRLFVGDSWNFNKERTPLFVFTFYPDTTIHGFDESSAKIKTMRSPFSSAFGMRPVMISLVKLTMLITFGLFDRRPSSALLTSRRSWNSRPRCCADSWALVIKSRAFWSTVAVAGLSASPR